MIQKMIIPKKIQPGDEIRVIAPSKSLSIISEENILLATEKLQKLGFRVSFSQNCRECDMSSSSSIQSRVNDIHEAFRDPGVKAIFTAIGGFNSNQILKYLDFELIRKNPKILCGYSDITALANAITAKTGMVTYSGLQFSTWAMQEEFEYNLSSFKKCLMEAGPFAVTSSDTWSDDAWYRDQKKRNIRKNEGFKIIHPGSTEGVILGGNLCTFNLLRGTEFMPDLTHSILFIEDDNIVGNYFSVEFDRNLQSLIHQPHFDKVKGIVFGRFQDGAMAMEELSFIVDSKKELKHIPILANVDFGHTNPMITFPIGGTARMEILQNTVELEILEH